MNVEMLLLAVPVAARSGDRPRASITPSFLVKLQAIHQALAISGHQPRSKDTTDAQIRAERDSWQE